MKLARIICLCILLTSLLSLCLPSTILAQEESGEDTINLSPVYGKLEDTSPGASFEFEVELRYTGAEGRDFDLVATGPQNWSTYVLPSYGDQRIGSIRFEPFSATKKVKVAASPPYFLIPEAGEYEITLEAKSGDIKGSAKLTAVITDTYLLGLTATNERLNTTATAGKDNFFSIDVENTGSGTLENIKFSSRKPSGWTIEFTPEEIDELSSGSYQTIDVNIKPDAKAIAGDYEITLTADATQTQDDITIRVTVKTPTIMGFVAVGIILVVIAGVAAIFMRFSRR